MTYFLDSRILVILFCVFYCLFFLCATSENDTSTLTSIDYETFLENDSFTAIEQNQSQWYNISATNISEVNITETTIVNEGHDNVYNWQWYDSYLSYTTPDENICVCDLHSNACDINCCCDEDCSEDDMRVFSSCHHSQVSYIDENYCYQTDIILRNNTVYRMQRDRNNGLLCIVHNNLKQHLRYRDLPLLKSHRDLDVLLNYQSKIVYSWDAGESKEDKEQDTKYGNSISISISDMKTTWSLPFPCFVDSCSCKRQVLYLEDFKSSCSLTIGDLQSDCESNDALSGNSYINFCLSTQKGFSNNLFTRSKEANSNNELYSEAKEICFPKKEDKPTFESNICRNVVSHIHFTVYHNGISGIQEIVPNFIFVDISSNISSLTQQFSVEFKWYNSSEVTKRSGNPGYQVGLPVVTSTNGSQSDEEPFKIKIQPKGLTVLDKNSMSLCHELNRKSVKFGKNLKTSCYFKTDIRDCKTAQESIYNIILGEGRDNMFVGIFGNANESNREEWIEAYYEGYDFPNDAVNDRCHLTTGLKINIVYSAVGTVQNPQFKILGLGYHFIQSKDVDISNGLENLILSTSVSFFDVTEPVIPHYPKAPSLEVSLPADFFYPFLQGT